MNKKVYLISICIMVFFTVGVFIFIKNNKINRVTDDTIKTFHYNFGSYFAGYWEYDISLDENEDYIFKAKGQNGVILNIDKKVSIDVLNDIKKIINNNKIYKWNGFSKTDDNILDGYGFNLIIEYTNGEVITASGYTKFPDGYDVGHKALSEYLESIK